MMRMTLTKIMLAAAAMANTNNAANPPAAPTLTPPLETNGDMSIYGPNHQDRWDTQRWDTQRELQNIYTATTIASNCSNTY
jgi:hypothetical protein